MKVVVYSQDNKEKDKIELKEEIFNQEAKKEDLHQVVRMSLWNKRAGTAANKSRMMVRGGGKKPFRQKGTGRARQGSSRSPLMPGGGVTFFKQPLDYHMKLNKKFKKKALCEALSLKLKDNKLFILDDMNLKDIKTKSAIKMLDNFKLTDQSVLMVDEPNNNLKLSIRNLPKVKYLKRDGLNVFDILKYDYLMISKAACEKVNLGVNKNE